MSEVLVILAHPTLEHARANPALADAARAVAGVTVHDLYESYPDFTIDVPAEQTRLKACKALVLQYPVYWYATPAMLKEWIDLVWQKGFAYGGGEMALKGKPFLLALTTGGDEAAYSVEGHHGHPLETFLMPMVQSARLCGLDWQDPFVVMAAPRLDEAARSEAALRYQARLTALVTQVQESRHD